MFLACAILTLTALLPLLVVRWPLTVMAGFLAILFVAGCIIASASASKGRPFFEQVWNELAPTGDEGPHSIYDDDMGV